MFDLGCGLGGASAAMRDRGWNVYRIDRERDVKADRYCDLRSLLTLPRGVDLLWASTCCNQFSVLRLPFRNSVNARKPIDLSVELHVKRLIDESRPRFWLVENVVHARKWLNPIFGPPRATVAGHVIWGNLPLLVPWVKPYKFAMDSHTWSGRPRHLKKSLIPYEVSSAIANTVENYVGRI
jgi:hypothetical protein